MPLSTDVYLPRDHIAVFPDRCVRCGDDPQKNTVRLVTHPISWLTWLFWFGGRSVKVDVPACHECAIRIRIFRWGDTFVVLIIAFLVMFLIWPFIDEMVARPLRKYVALGLTLVCAAPWFFWQVIFPPPIDITASKDSISYEFADEEYAIEFLAENELAGAKWTKIE